MIDLRSDTVTLPSSKILEAFNMAKVGDDAFEEDQSAKKLQDYCKELFDVEDAVFVTSGMLANRLAVLIQTEPGDEVVTEYGYHINFFDSGATAAICKVVINGRNTLDGILRVTDIVKAFNSKPRYKTFAQLKLVTLENTINSRQGKIFPLEELKEIRSYAIANSIKIHLDGARLFNAHIATGIPLQEYAKEVDTLSICFAKGLGAPFGSMLMGNKEAINKARRLKTWLGSGYHQIGFYAEAAFSALRYQLDRLKYDHYLAQMLAQGLSKIKEFNISLEDIETNMVFMDISFLNIQINDFIDQCAQHGLLLFPWLPTIVRAVTHRDICEEDVQEAIKIISRVVEEAKALNYEN